MNKPLSSKVQEAADFLFRLNPHNVTVASIDPRVPSSPTVRMFKAAEIDQLKVFIANRSTGPDTGMNLHLMVNRTRRRMTSKPSESDVAFFDWAHVEGDPIASESSDEAKARHRAAFEAAKIRPTIVYDSGNGCVALWKLTKPIKITSQEDIERCKGINRALAAQFGNKAQQGIDTVHSIEHLLRLPHTLNIPDARKKAAGRVPVMAGNVTVDDVAYDVAELPPPIVGAHTKDIEPGEIGDVDEIDIELCPISDKLKADILNGPPPEYFDADNDLSPSEFRHAVAKQALREGLKPEQVVGILMDEAYGISRRRNDRQVDEKAARRDVAAAMASIVAEIVDPVKEFDDAPIDPDTDIGDEPDITDEELASEEPSDFTGDRVQHMTVEDQEWIVEDMIPADDVIGYYGDGGSGKTYTTLQLVVAKTAGKEWLGKPTGDPAKTMVFSCEEYKDKIVPRLHKIMESITSPYNQEGENRIEWDDIKGLKVKVMAGHDSILARLDKNTGKIRATKLFKWVEKEVRAWGPKLVVFDALYDIFGENQNDLPSARQFVRLLRRLSKKLKIAIIVTAHPSQTGMQTGTGTSGTVGWRNAFRGFLYVYIEHPKSGAGIKVHHIESRKQNYGAPDVLIDAVWNDGLFTPVYTDKAEREKECKRQFMELLRAYLKDGRSVTHTATATNAAPKVFAADREKAAGFSKAEFKDAMNSLFNAGRIKVVGYRKANRTHGERLEPVG